MIYQDFVMLHSVDHVVGLKCYHFDTLRPRQNGRHFANDIFKCIFLNENVWILIKILLKFVPKGPIKNIPGLVQIMAWRRPSHYLNQWWLIYWRIYASHGLNELMLYDMLFLITIFMLIWQVVCEGCWEPLHLTPLTLWQPGWVAYTTQLRGLLPKMIPNSIVKYPEIYYVLCSSKAIIFLQKLAYAMLLI